MKSAKSVIKINDREITVNVEADEIGYGDDSIWYNRDLPPGSDAPWSEQGYTVQPFL